MTPKKEKALAALLVCPTKDAAAKRAGITGRTMSIYIQDPEFQVAYRKAFGELVETATRQAQQCLHPALDTLRSVMQDTEQNGQVRVSAARSLLEYAMKLNYETEILSRLDELEKSLSGGEL